MSRQYVPTAAFAIALLIQGAAIAQTPPAQSAVPATPAPAATRAQPAMTAPPAAAPAPKAIPSGGADRMEGLAAHYTNKLNGHKTASGKTYNPDALTAAHPTLPFGTKVKVTNTTNQHSVVVTINDRGPTQPDRVIDVSRAAAGKLGMMKSGTTPVTLEVVTPAPTAKTKS